MATTPEPTPIKRLMTEVTAYADKCGRPVPAIVRSATGNTGLHQTLLGLEARVLEAERQIRAYMAANPPPDEGDSNG